MSSVSVLATSSQPATPQPSRLLDHLHASAIARFGRPNPAERYVQWGRKPQRRKRRDTLAASFHPRRMAFDTDRHVRADTLGNLAQGRWIEFKVP